MIISLEWSSQCIECFYLHGPSIFIVSTSVVSANWMDLKKKLQKVSKSKTWICSTLVTIYIVFTWCFSTAYMAFVMPNVRIPEQEERRPPRQCNSQNGKFIADSSQGSCCIQCSSVGSESPEPKLLHKFIGWAHAVGSWFKWIGYKFAKQFHWSNTLKTFTHGTFPGVSAPFLIGKHCQC